MRLLPRSRNHHGPIMDYRNRLLVGMIIALGIWLSPMTRSDSTAFGQIQAERSTEFRIDTDIYTDETKPPVHTTQTMFLATRTIEWDDTHRRLLVVDYKDQSVMLADLPAQRKCRIGMPELEDRISNLRSQMTSEEFATWTSPTQARLDEKGFYELACERSAYRFKTKSPSIEKMAIDYSEFADWSVKMHAVNPPYKPPLLRMQLNAFLRDQRALPIELRLLDKRSSSSKEIIARLIVQDQLSAMDLDRIRDWDVLTATLKNVSEVEYFRQASAGPINRPSRK
ncbi:MAG: hypothetical protein ACK5EO_17995 [Planctomycetota bacterium]|jgi:hypothetical protein